MMRLKSTTLALSVSLGVALGASDAHALKNPMLLNLMKHLTGYVNDGNMQATSHILNLVKVMGPPEYAAWPRLSDKASVAAGRGDSVGLKAACKECHDQYREAYRAKYGGGGKPEPAQLPRD
jgi:hypothetical protein